MGLCYEYNLKRYAQITVHSTKTFSWSFWFPTRPLPVDTVCVTSESLQTNPLLTFPFFVFYLCAHAHLVRDLFLMLHWNSLPCKVRTSDTLTSFRSHLKLSYWLSVCVCAHECLHSSHPLDFTLSYPVDWVYMCVCVCVHMNACVQVIFQISPPQAILLTVCGCMCTWMLVLSHLSDLTSSSHPIDCVCVHVNMNACVQVIFQISPPQAILLTVCVCMWT